METKRYLDHISRKILYGKCVAVCSMIAAIASAINLINFIQSGNSVLHPAASFYLLVASVGLFIAAVISIRTSKQYYLETIQMLGLDGDGM